MHKNKEKELAVELAGSAGVSSQHRRRIILSHLGQQNPGTRARREWKKRRRTSGKGGRR